MGLFDIFSNSDAQNAAQAQAAGYTAGYNQLVPLLNQGTGALQNYTGQANTALGTGAGNATGALNQNYGNALQTLQNQQGVNTGGQSQLASLLGFGPQGSAGIQSTLQNLPGYQFALNQGAQNVMRNQAATGALNSGATQAELQAQGQGLAQQNYTNYLTQLQPFLNASNAGAANIAGTQTGLGQGLAGIATGLGQGQSGNLMNLGQGINQNYNTQGAAAYGTQAGIGNAQAQADYANLASSGALWGSLIGAAGNIAGAAMGKPPTGGSEPRFKEDIKLHGHHRSGLPIYQFRYRGGKKRYYGVMAPDIQKYCPDAVYGNPGFRNVSKAVVSQILREYGHGLRSLG